MYVSTAKAAAMLGLHPNTVRRYADEGKIPYIRTPKGQRRYNIKAFLESNNDDKTVVCYCRVSSNKQKDDLQRQIAFMRSQFPNAEVVYDIGSGINLKRKGLQALLERASKGDKLKVVVAHKDRLARFGTELIEFILKQNGGELVVLDSTKASPQEELAADVLAILHVFSARLHGIRKYYNKIKEDLPSTEQEAEEDALHLDINGEMVL